MYKTRIEIPEKTRTKLIKTLWVRIADAIDLSMQFKQAHWNVKGPRFFALHEFFDKLAETFEDQVDEIAERITSLGGVAEGTLQVVAQRTSLAPYPLDIRTGGDHLLAIAGELAKYCTHLRKAIDTADDLDDDVTQDLFTRLAGEADKSLWLVEAHLQAKD